MAPEVVSCKNYNGKLADVWSLGIILYLLLCGKFPFQATNLHQLYQTIRTTQITFPADVSKDAQQLIRSILLVDPPKRLPLVSILAHPWIKNEHNQIKTKQCDPQLREHAFDIFLAWEEGIAIIYKELDRLYGVSSENLVVAWQKAQHNSIVALGRLCLVAAERQFLSALSLNHPPLSNQERSRPHQPTRKQQLEQLIGLVQQSLVQ